MERVYKTIPISQYIRIDGDFKSWVMKFPNLTTHSGLVGSLMNSPKFKARFGNSNDPKVKAEIEALAGSGFGRFDVTPEKMVENYFEQWGL